jgi:hypothetical protein
VSLTEPQRFPIRFEAWYRVLSSALLLPPSSAYVELSGDEVRVHMGWAFQSRLPKAAIASVAETPERPLSRGVHGLAGRWLVNGSGRGLLTIDLAPAQRGRVTGYPVSLRQLTVSVEEPAALMAALRD